jgi:hypothetical protein
MPKKKKVRKREDEEDEEDEIEGDNWTSPICFESQSASARMRETLEDLGCTFKRTRASKQYHQIMVMMPLPRVSYVYRFRLMKPIQLIIDFYDTKPTHAGILPYMDIRGITEQKMVIINKILDEFMERLPRKPWHFTMGQKLQHGYLSDWRKSKKAWRELGYDTK